VEILEKLVELEVRDEEQVGRRVRSQVFQILCSMSETEFEAQTLQLLKARGINENRLWEYQAALGEKEAVFNSLLLRLEDGNEAVRRPAAQAFVRLGNVSGEILVSPASALGNLGNASEVINLVQDLKDEDNSVRYEAAFALGNLGNASKTVISALVQGLEDGDKSVRREAAEALGNLGNASEPVISALLLRLEDGYDFVAYSAASALSKLGMKSSDVLPAVVQWVEQHQDTEYVGLGIDVLWDLVAGEGNRSPVVF
jgi:HEAT repeat protein